MAKSAEIAMPVEAVSHSKLTITCIEFWYDVLLLILCQEDYVKGGIIMHGGPELVKVMNFVAKKICCDDVYDILMFKMCISLPSRAVLE